MSTPPAHIRSGAAWLDTAVKGATGPQGRPGLRGPVGPPAPLANWDVLTQTEFDAITPQLNRMYVIVRGSADHGDYARAVLRDGPVCYFRLGDDGANNAALDEIGGPDGQYFGSVDFRSDNLLPGDPLGSSMHLDGAGGLFIPDSPATQFGARDQAFSIEVWVRVDAWDPAGRYVIWDSGPTLPLGWPTYAPYKLGIGWDLQANSLGMMFTAAGMHGGQNNLGSMTLGVPAHVVYAFSAPGDPGGRTHRRFVNGIDVTSTLNVQATGIIPQSFVGVILGHNRRWPNGTHNGFFGWPLRGFLQEFAIYDYALDVGQALAHYNAAQ